MADPVLVTVILIRVPSLVVVTENWSAIARPDLAPMPHPPMSSDEVFLVDEKYPE